MKWWRGRGTYKDWAGETNLRFSRPPFENVGLWWRVQRAKRWVRGQVESLLRTFKLFVGTALAVVLIDWGAKVVVNQELMPIPNDEALVPIVGEEAVGRNWFWLGDSGTLAVTHVEHAYRSVDGKWRASVFADQGELVQRWVMDILGIGLSFWVAALIAFVLMVGVGVFAIGLLFRVRVRLLAVVAGLFVGGAVANQVELGVVGHVTDWLWVSGDLGKFALSPLLGVSEGVMNFADAAIIVAVYVFALVLFWRFLTSGLLLVAWAWDATTGWLNE